MTVAETTVWDTRSFLDRASTSRETALVILNTPLPPQPLFARLWDTGTSASLDRVVYPIVADRADRCPLRRCLSSSAVLCRWRSEPPV